jgi:hypothetical protein
MLYDPAADAATLSDPSFFAAGMEARTTARDDHDDAEDAKVVRLFPGPSVDDLVPIGGESDRAGAWGEDRPAALLDGVDASQPRQRPGNEFRSDRTSTRVWLSGVAGAALAAGVLVLAASTGRDHATSTGIASSSGAAAHSSRPAAQQPGGRARRARAGTTGQSSAAGRRHSTKQTGHRRERANSASTERVLTLRPTTQTPDVSPVATRTQSQPTPSSVPAQPQGATVAASSQGPGAGSSSGPARPHAFGDSGVLGPGSSPDG